MQKDAALQAFARAKREHRRWLRTREGMLATALDTGRRFGAVIRTDDALEPGDTEPDASGTLTDDELKTLPY